MSTMSTTATQPNEKKRKTLLAGITLAFIAAGIAYAAYYQIVLPKVQETDNAYVGGNLVNLSSQVTGNVTEIRADETQMAQAGAPLIQLDPADADIALRQADARAAIAVAVKQEEAAKAGVSGVSVALHPAVQAAKADYVQAWLAARRNTIVAPVSGYVAKRSVQIGARATPGASLMAIVPLDQLWVDANFKESELKNIRVGQAARVEADMYGSNVAFHGRVVGLSAGTGSAFSLLPAQNASGNWIKVVQRLPVRIALDPTALKAHPLRIGLSTTVSVDISNTGGPVLGAAMPQAPVYTTQALKQPLQQAANAADTIIAHNL